MDHRQLFHEIMHYGRFDRMPVLHWGGWTETRARWVAEGMPADADDHRFFDTVEMCDLVVSGVEPFPPFPFEMIEETAEYSIYRDGHGVVQKSLKNQSATPHPVEYAMKGAADWPAYKRRLQPDPARLGPWLDQAIARAEAGGRPIGIGPAPLAGWVRNWMGVEGMSYLLYDDPEVFGDIIATLADLTCWAWDRILPKFKVKPSLALGWEDICGKSGPLISPKLFRRYVAPAYARMSAKAREFGIDIFAVDSDGLIESLIPVFLEAGVNTMYPLEIGTWHADPYALRRKFGRDLRIVGGFDKRVLEQGRAAIDAELERRLPLMKEGGYLPMPDHMITPGTPLADYRYYLEKIRALRF